MWCFLLYLALGMAFCSIVEWGCSFGNDFDNITCLRYINLSCACSSVVHALLLMPYLQCTLPNCEKCYSLP